MIELDSMPTIGHWALRIPTSTISKENHMWQPRAGRNASLRRWKGTLGSQWSFWTLPKIAWTWQQASWQFPAVTKVLRHYVAPHGTLQSLHVKSLTLCRYHECSSSPYSLLILFPNCQHLEVLFSDLLVKTRFFSTVTWAHNFLFSRFLTQPLQPVTPKFVKVILFIPNS